MKGLFDDYIGADAVRTLPPRPAERRPEPRTQTRTPPPHAAPSQLTPTQTEALIRAPRLAWAFPWQPGRAEGPPASLLLARGDLGAAETLVVHPDQDAVRHVFAERARQVAVVPLAPCHYRWARHFGYAWSPSTYCLHTMECWMDAENPFRPDRPDPWSPDSAGDVLDRFVRARAWFLQHDQVPLLRDEMAFVPCIARMEDRGLYLDRAEAGRLAEHWRGVQGSLQQRHAPVNLASPRDILQALRSELGNKVSSTNADTLQRIIDRQRGGPAAELARAVLEFRKGGGIAAKVESYLDYAGPDGLVRATWFPHGAATGRMSARQPSLQQVDKGGDLRRLFTAGSGRALVSIDYGAQDLRVLASLSGDRDLARTLRDPHADPHTETQAKLNLPSRAIAKIITYALPYGAGTPRIAGLTGLPREQAKAYIDAYHERFPGVSDYLDHQRRHAQRQVVDPTTGKIRPLDPKAPRHERERQAITTPVQAVGARQIKKALEGTEAILRRYDGAAVMALHDEIVFAMPDAAVAECAPQLARCMEHVLPLPHAEGPIPSVCHIQAGRNWGEQEDLADLSEAPQPAWASVDRPLRVLVQVLQQDADGQQGRQALFGGGDGAVLPPFMPGLRHVDGGLQKHGHVAVAVGFQQHGQMALRRLPLQAVKPVPFRLQGVFVVLEVGAELLEVGRQQIGEHPHGFGPGQQIGEHPTAVVVAAQYRRRLAALQLPQLFVVRAGAGAVVDPVGVNQMQVAPHGRGAGVGHAVKGRGLRSTTPEVSDCNSTHPCAGRPHPRAAGSGDSPLRRGPVARPRGPGRCGPPPARCRVCPGLRSGRHR